MAKEDQLKNIRTKNLTGSWVTAILKYEEPNGSPINRNYTRGMQSMSLRKHGIKAIGLSLLAALGLMIFAAAGAQAEVGSPGYFEILEKEITETETATGSIDTVGDGLLVEALNLALICPNVTVEEGTLLALQEVNKETIGVGHAVLKFTGCKAFERSTLKVLPCLVRDDVKAGLTDEQISAEVLLLPRLTAGGGRYILAEPKPGNAFFTKIDFEGAKCSLPELVEVKGTLAIEQSSTTLPGVVVQLIKEAPASVQTTLGDELKFGVNKATIDSTAFVELNGKDKGKTFLAI